MICLDTNPNKLNMLESHGFSVEPLTRDHVIVVRGFGCGVRKPIKDLLGVQVMNISKVVDLENKEGLLKLVNEQVLLITRIYLGT